ncbi:MAG: GNAT family protein [Dehalococcoidia bacterium]
MLPLNAGLIGERVRLRPLEEGDAPLFQRWFNDPETLRWLSTVGYQHSLSAEEQFIREHHENGWEHEVTLVIEATDRGAEPVPIGNIVLRGLSAEHRHAEVGIAIGDDESRGRGYGEDAMRTICRYGFQDLDLHRIELTTLAYNVRAVRSYEQVGFVLEGRRREHRYKGGRYWDTLVMGLLRSDFAAGEEG